MKYRNQLLLLLTATIWGTSFVAQSVGMDYVEPFTFNGIRSIMGGLVLLPFIYVNDRRTNKNKDEKGDKKLWLIGGIICGIVLCAASNIQQIGIKYTSVGKAGFITAMYIVIVPLIYIFIKKKFKWLTFISIPIAVAGLYMLCINEQMSFSRGEFLILICSVLFAIHIIIIDYLSPRTDGVKIACVQFFVCGVISLIIMCFIEHPDINAIFNVWKPLCYTGILSCGVAYTLQIIGQKGVDPTAASLILSLESVISVLSGWLILHEELSLKEIVGCLFMAVAIVLVQIPQKEISIVRKNKMGV